MGLAHGDGSKRKVEWQVGRTYHVFHASATHGYEFVKKRKFGSERYPGYVHSVSIGKNRTPTLVAKGAEVLKEYIFQKTDKSFEQIAQESNFKEINVEGRNYVIKELEDIKTDDESSSYDCSEDEKENNEEPRERKKRKFDDEGEKEKEAESAKTQSLESLSLIEQAHRTVIQDINEANLQHGIHQSMQV
jgi:hypothetical protein